MKGIFVTGTGTDVGKTVVEAGILRMLIKQGIDAVPMKPVQTGCEIINGTLVPPDLVFSLETAGLHPDEEERKLMSPYCYEPACSPHLAGEMAGYSPELSTITDAVSQLGDKHELVVVEGAGGIMVPLNGSDTMLDLMRALDFPVILVAHAGLGTINHTLLSIQVLRNAGLTVLGVIFNKTHEYDPESAFIIEDNPKAVAKFGDIRVLGNLPYLPDISPERNDLWDIFAGNIEAIQL